MILFIDDLQWADSATLDALQYALRRWRAQSARIMLLVSLRTEGLQVSGQSDEPGLVAWLTDIDHAWMACHLDLEPLDEVETVKMLQGLLEPPAPDFAQWVFSETRGHPFYVMETLKDLLERGALHPRRRGKDGWSFEVDRRHDLGQSVRVPSTVRAVIRSRLEPAKPRGLYASGRRDRARTRIDFRAPVRRRQSDPRRRFAGPGRALERPVAP